MFQLQDVFAYRYYKTDSGILSLVFSPWVKGHNYFLEKPWRNNDRNVSCIPANTYKTIWDFSNKFQRFTWHITNVPNRSGIRIHPGNTIKDSLGCPLTGLATGYDQNGNLAVWNSRSSLANFEENMDRKQPSKRWFNLHIINLFPFGGNP